MADHLERIGQIMGDYRLLRWLGGGAFGNVYLAEQMRDGRDQPILPGIEGNQSHLAVPHDHDRDVRPQGVDARNFSGVVHAEQFDDGGPDQIEDQFEDEAEQGVEHGRSLRLA